MALYVYELTGSARDLSFALALQLLPWMVVGPVAGMLADHLERKAILVVAYAFQAALVALLPFTTTLGQVYALAEAGTATLAGWMVSSFGPGIGLYVIGGTISVGAIAVAALTSGHRAIARFSPNADRAR